MFGLEILFTEADDRCNILMRRSEVLRAQKRKRKFSKNIWQQPQSTPSLLNSTILLERAETSEQPPLFSPTPNHQTHACWLSNGNRKSRYTTHNHNIMVIFFEFNLNILNFTVFDYYLHWTFERVMFMSNSFLVSMLFRSHFSTFWSSKVLHLAKKNGSLCDKVCFFFCSLSWCKSACVFSIPQFM